MKHDENALDRLLRVARQAPSETPGSMSFPLEARILAGWRSGVPEDESVLLAMLFRRAVIFGTIVMVLSIGWSQLGDAPKVPGAVVIANLERGLQVVP